jgi:3-hydroxyisobutyrate dehydrogenase-like beta-hydroxyacid dehydrogenase
MSLPIVAILAPGDMGHAVGAMLRQHGVRVITNLAGRSPASAERAAKAGFEAMADDVALVRAADLVLSIVPPAEARDVARRIAGAARGGGTSFTYVDCNAVSPDTARDIGVVVEAAGLAYVDAGIIGPPPKPGETKTRFYAAGRDAPAFARLAQYGLDIRVLDGATGSASGLKMCYAALSKGFLALLTQSLVTAHHLGLAGALRDELALSRPQALAEAERGLPQIPGKAYRWIAEMEEIAATFAAAGLSPDPFRSIAEVYRFATRVAGRPIATADDYAAALAAAPAPAPRAAD